MAPTVFHKHEFAEITGQSQFISDMVSGSSLPTSVGQRLGLFGAVIPATQDQWDYLNSKLDWAVK